MRRTPLFTSGMLRVAVALAVTAALAGCSSLASGLSSALATSAPPGAGTATAVQQSGPGLVRVHDPQQVTYSRTLRACKFRDGDQLPDPACTPGSVDPNVTQANIHSTICRSGYTKTVRPPASETDHAKFDVAYPAYHVPSSDRSELDHLVSLELGGSNDIANLWPEIGKLPNPKDKVENDLHRAVCDGQVTLAAAQHAIATDWLTAEATLHIG